MKHTILALLSTFAGFACDLAEPGTVGTVETVGTASETTTEGPESSSETGEPLQECGAAANEASCNAIGALRDADSGRSGGGCYWATFDQVEYGDDFCSIIESVEQRCIALNYQGDGCQASDCLPDGNVYFEERADGAVWMTTTPAFCEHQPEGLSQCFSAGGEAPCGCACDIPEAPPPMVLDDVLVDARGCSDITVFARNEDDTVGLLLRFRENLVAQAVETGETIVATYEATALEDFEVVEGQAVTMNQCDDVFWEEEQIERRYVPIGGTVTVTVVPDPDANPDDPGGAAAQASITFDGVRFSVENRVWSIMDYAIEDIAVGWFPG